MAEPNNTPYPPATPAAQTPRSASPHQPQPILAPAPAPLPSTQKPKVLHIGDPIKYNPDTYAAFAAQFEVIRPSTPDRQRPAFAAALRDRKWGDFSSPAGAPAAKWASGTPSCAGAGFDWADTQLLGERGVVYCNSGLAAAEAVADFAVAMVISTFRHLPWCMGAAGDEAAFRDCHARATGVSHTLRSQVLGLVGFGNIGQQIAQRLGVGFGMAVHYFDLIRKDEATEGAYKATFHPTLEALLQSSDCVVLCTPAGGKIITKESLAWFKPGARFVNIARGSLVDEEALADALEDERLSAVALDVHENEPKPHAMAGTKAMLTCHNAGGTVETHAGFEELSMRNIMAILGGGEPITPVNLQYLRK
uniref:D-mandelate dehydrogenase, putative n=1 Tax=Colletotrichum fructicola (strain Nara gc5) TaxID=1213859 RepID=L2GBT4_COLFN